MKKYFDKKPAKRELKKLKKKTEIVQEQNLLTESQNKYDEWNVSELGINKKTFDMIYGSMKNLDKATPITYADDKKYQNALKKFNLSENDF